MPRVALCYGHKISLRDARNGCVVVSTNNQLRPLGVAPAERVPFEDCVFQILNGEDVFDLCSSGADLLFGNVVRLLHCGSSALVCESRARASVEKSAHRIELLKPSDEIGVINPLPSSSGASSISQTSRWKVLPRHQIRSEGQRVTDADIIVLRSVSGDSYLHVAGAQLCSSEGLPMEHFFELNAAGAATGFEVRAYDTSAAGRPRAVPGIAGTALAPVVDDAANGIACGDCILMVSREDRAFVSSVGTGDVVLSSIRASAAASDRAGVAGMSASFNGGLAPSTSSLPLAGASAAELFDAHCSVAGRPAFPGAALFVVEHQQIVRGGSVHFGSGGRYRLKNLLSSLYICLKRKDEIAVLARDGSTATAPAATAPTRHRQARRKSSVFRSAAAESAFAGRGAGGSDAEVRFDASGADDVPDCDARYVYWLTNDPRDAGTIVSFHQATDDASPCARNLSRVFLEFPLVEQGLWFASGGLVGAFPAEKHAAAALLREQMVKNSIGVLQQHQRADGAFADTATGRGAAAAAAEALAAATQSGLLDRAQGAGQQLREFDMQLYNGAKELVAARSISQRDGLELLKTPPDVFQQLNAVRSLVPPFVVMKAQLEKFRADEPRRTAPPPHLVEQMRENLSTLIRQCTHSRGEPDPLLREGTPDAAAQSRIAEQHVLPLLLDVVDLALGADGPLGGIADERGSSAHENGRLASGLASGLVVDDGGCVLSGFNNNANEDDDVYGATAAAATQRRDRGLALHDTQHDKLLGTTAVYDIINLKNGLTDIVKLVFRLFRQVALGNSRTSEALAPLLPRLMRYAAELSRMGVKEAMNEIFQDNPAVVDRPDDLNYLHQVIALVRQEGRGAGGSTKLLTALVMCGGRGIKHAQDECGAQLLRPAVDELVNGNTPLGGNGWAVCPFYRLWMRSSPQSPLAAPPVPAAAVVSTAKYNDDDNNGPTGGRNNDRMMHQLSDSNGRLPPEIVVNSASLSGSLVMESAGSSCLTSAAPIVVAAPPASAAAAAADSTIGGATGSSLQHQLVGTNTLFALEQRHEQEQQRQQKPVRESRRSSRHGSGGEEDEQEDGRDGGAGQVERLQRCGVFIDMHNVSRIFPQQAFSASNVFAELQATETKEGVPIETFCALSLQQSRRRSGAARRSPGSSETGSVYTADDPMADVFGGGGDGAASALQELDPAVRAEAQAAKRPDALAHIQGLARQFMLMAALCADRHAENIALCRQLVPLDVLIAIISLERLPGIVRAQAFNLAAACYIAVPGRADVLEDVQSVVHVMDKYKPRSNTTATSSNRNSNGHRAMSPSASTSANASAPPHHLEFSGRNPNIVLHAATSADVFADRPLSAASSSSSSSSSSAASSSASHRDGKGVVFQLAASMRLGATTGLSATTRVALDTVRAVDARHEYVSPLRPRSRPAAATPLLASSSSGQQLQPQQEHRREFSAMSTGGGEAMESAAIAFKLAAAGARAAEIDDLVGEALVPALEKYLLTHSAMRIADRGENECVTWAVRATAQLVRYGYIRAADFSRWLAALRPCADGRDDIPPPQQAATEWWEGRRFLFDEQNQVIMQTKLETLGVFNKCAMLIRADMVDRLVAAFEAGGGGAVLPFVADVLDFRPGSPVHALSLHRAALREERDRRIAEHGRPGGGGGGGFFAAAGQVLSVGKEVLDAVGVGEALRKISALFGGGDDDDADPSAVLQRTIGPLVDVLIDAMHYQHEPVVASAAALLFDVTCVPSALEPMLRRVQILPAPALPFYETVKPLQLFLAQFEAGGAPVSVGHLPRITEALQSLTEIARQSSAGGERRRLETAIILGNLRLHLVVARIIAVAPIQQELDNLLNDQQFGAAALPDATVRSGAGGSSVRRQHQRGHRVGDSTVTAASTETPTTLMLRAAYAFLHDLLPEHSIQSELLPHIATFSSQLVLSHLTERICELLVRIFTGRADICASVHESVIADICATIVHARDVPLLAHVLRLLCFQEDQPSFDVVQGNAGSVLRALLETEGLGPVLRCSGFFTGRHGVRLLRPLLRDADALRDADPVAVGELMLRLELLQVVAHCIAALAGGAGASRAAAADMRNEARVAMFGDGVLLDELPHALDHPPCVSAVFLVLLRLVYLDDASQAVPFVENVAFLRCLRRIHAALRSMLTRLAEEGVDADSGDEGGGDAEQRDIARAVEVPVAAISALPPVAPHAAAKQRASDLTVTASVVVLVDEATQRSSAPAAAASAAPSPRRPRRRPQRGSDPRAALFSDEADWYWLVHGVVPFVQSALRVLAVDDQHSSRADAERRREAGSLGASPMAAPLIKVAPEVGTRIGSVVGLLYQLFDFALRENVNYDAAKAASDAHFIELANRLRKQQQQQQQQGGDGGGNDPAPLPHPSPSRRLDVGPAPARGASSSDSDSQDGHRHAATPQRDNRATEGSTKRRLQHHDLLAAATAAVAAADSTPDVIHLQNQQHHSPGSRSGHHTINLHGTPVVNPLSRAGSHASVAPDRALDHTANSPLGSFGRASPQSVQQQQQQQQPATTVRFQTPEREFDEPRARRTSASQRRRRQQQRARSDGYLEPLPLILRSASSLFFAPPSASSLVGVRRLPPQCIRSLMSVVQTAFGQQGGGMLDFLRAGDFRRFSDVIARLGGALPLDVRRAALQRLSRRKQRRADRHRQQQQFSSDECTSSNSDEDEEQDSLRELEVYGEWRKAVDIFAAASSETAYLTTARILLRKGAAGHGAVRSMVRVLESGAVSDALRARMLAVLRQVVLAQLDPLSDAALVVPHPVRTAAVADDRRNDEDDTDDESDGEPGERVSAEADDNVVLDMRPYGADNKDVLSLGLSLSERQDIFAKWGAAQRDIFGGPPALYALAPKLTRLMSSAHRPTVVEALLAGNALLHGGHRPNQLAVFRFFAETTREDFFLLARRLLVSAAAAVRDRRRTLGRWIDELSATAAPHRRTAKRGRGASASASAASAAPLPAASFAEAVASLRLIESMYDFSLPCALLRFLQLLCEGHFTPLQQMLHQQLDNQVSIDVLAALLGLLDELADSVDQQTYSMASQLLAALTETVQGSGGTTLENQLFYVNNNVGKIIAKMFVGRHTMLMPQQRTALRSAAATLLLALLEGHFEPRIYTTLIGSIDMLPLVRAMDAQYRRWRCKRSRPYGSAEADAHAMQRSREESSSSSSESSAASSDHDEDQDDAGHDDGDRDRDAAPLHALRRPKQRGGKPKPGHRRRRSNRTLAHISQLAARGFDVGRGLVEGLVLGPDAGGGGDDELVDELKLSVDIFTFLRMILDATLLYPAHAVDVADSAGRDARALFTLSRSYKALHEMVASLEICNRQGLVERVYFRVPEVCHRNLTDEMKDRVLLNVDNSGDAARVADFLEVCQNRLLLELDFVQQMSRTRVISVVYRYKVALDAVALAVMLALNAMLLGGAHFEHAERNDAHLPPALEYPFYALAVAAVTLQALLAVNFTLGELRAHVHACWAEWQDERNRERIKRSKDSLSIEPPRLETGPPQARRGRLAVAAYSVYFALRWLPTWRHLLFLAVALCGLLLHPGIFCLLLLQLVPRSPTLNNVLLAVWLNGRSLLLTAGFLLLLLFVFSVLAYYNLSGMYNEAAFGNLGCSSLLSCFFASNLKVGMLMGGGVGEVASPPVYAGTRYIGQFVGRIFVDLLFWIVLVVLFTQLIFGQIIDAFSSLRQEKAERESAETGRCFICGLSRATLDKQSGYEDHVRHEHNVWAYLAFLKFLALKQRDEYTGAETWVSECVAQGSIAFFPLGKSLFAQVREKFANAERDDGGMLRTATSAAHHHHQQQQQQQQAQRSSGGWGLEDGAASPAAASSPSGSPTTAGPDQADIFFKSPSIAVSSAFEQRPTGDAAAAAALAQLNAKLEESDRRMARMEQMIAALSSQLTATQK